MVIGYNCRKLSLDEEHGPNRRAESVDCQTNEPQISGTIVYCSGEYHLSVVAGLLAMALRVCPSILINSATPFAFRVASQSQSLRSPPKTLSNFQVLRAKMSTDGEGLKNSPSSAKVIDSHVHVLASLQEAEKYPYFPGQEPTLTGHADFLLQCMEEAGVDGALIVQPINHKFDHSYVTSVLKRYPSKFSGCCLANPAEDGSGIKQLEDLVSKDGYCAVRFNPYLWPSSEKMTNTIGKAMFSKAGELGVPVGFMCMKGLNLHFAEIEELCTEYPSTTVLIDHLGFCKPPINDEESLAFSNLLKLSKFAQVYLKFSALFRVSREAYPYKDLSSSLSQVVSSFGANRIMWGSDFPFVIPECGYKAGKEAVSLIVERASLSSSELDWIMGGTVMQLFRGHWISSST